VTFLKSSIIGLGVVLSDIPQSLALASEEVFKMAIVTYQFSEDRPFVGSRSDTLLTFVLLLDLSDRLCGLEVRVPGHRSGGRGSIPGATRFYEK
jgi:hypothetical protein